MDEENEILETETVDEETEELEQDVEAEEEESEEEEVEQDEEPEQKPRKKNGFQKRIDELTKKNYQKEYEIKALNDKLDFFINQNKQPAKAPEPERAPDPEDYDTNAEYVEAKVNYEVEQKLAEKLDKVEAERKASQEKAEKEKEAENIKRSYAERAAEASQRIPDFAEKIQNSTIDVGQDTLNLIMASEFGPDIAYHLATNEDDSSKISGMTPVQAAKLIGRLETKFENKQAARPKKKTKAPDPIGGLKSKKSTPSGGPPSDMKDYIAWRQKGGK